MYRAAFSPYARSIDELRSYYAAVVHAFAERLLNSPPAAEFPPAAEIHERIQQYRLTNPRDADCCTDLFKPLYLALVPRKSRHAAGEYYTPDWLADFVLDAVQYRGDPAVRLVDPMCGSGTFLLRALKRLIALASVRSMRPEAVAEHAVHAISGVEVNPVAALAAQVNTAAALAATLGLAKVAPLDVRVADMVRDAPDVGRFDLVVGNPPWVGWETLPVEYRQATMHLWARYGLLPQRGMDAILGKGKKDLAMLAAYTATDRLLQSGGRLGFVLPRSLFKSSGAGRGFRGFRFGQHESQVVGVERVEDFSALNVFPGAAAKAVVAVWTKGRPTAYPVPYFVWKKPARGIGIENAEFGEQFAIPAVATDPASAWLTASPRALPALQRMLGSSQYKAREGANAGGASGVYWVELLERRGETCLIRNLFDAGKRAVASSECEVEADLLYPLLRGKDLRAWSAVPSSAILVVQDPVTRKGIAEAELRSQYPLAWKYFQQFRASLVERAAFKRYFTRGSKKTATAAFYSMFNVGPYTFAPHKAVWRRMAAPLVAAAVGSHDGKPVVPQETLVFVPCESAAEAHFLVGVLNSKLFAAAVSACTEVGGKGFGSPHLLEWIAVPRFDPRSPNHAAIARGAEAAAAATGDRTPMFSALDDAVRTLWNLSASEAADVCEASV